MKFNINSKVWLGFTTFIIVVIIGTIYYFGTKENTLTLWLSMLGSFLSISVTFMMYNFKKEYDESISLENKKKKYYSDLVKECMDEREKIINLITSYEEDYFQLKTIDNEINENERILNSKMNVLQTRLLHNYYLINKVEQLLSKKYYLRFRDKIDKWIGEIATMNNYGKYEVFHEKLPVTVFSYILLDVHQHFDKILDGLNEKYK